MNDAPNPDTTPNPDTAQVRDYRDTVFLPQTGFPMRGDLPKKEPAILARWEKMDLWARLRAASAGRETFILHDGPPYANGNLHIGHALNKILKDVINRSRQMAGQDGLYIPGWDCHGLPIEWKIEEEYRRKNQDKDQVPILQFRAECRAYAAHWMGVQATEFRRLGVEGGWAERYATMDFPSEAAIANEICKFLLNGALYRGLRPVMWSPVEKTALAEAEIEYHDHTSTTIWVRFPVAETGLELLADASVVIWTTTPWTMPGNRAIAYGESFDYALAHVDAVAEGSLARVGEKMLIALDLLPQVCAETGIAAHHVRACLQGRRAGRHDLPPSAARPRLPASGAAAGGGFRHHRGRHRLRAHRPRAMARTISSWDARMGWKSPRPSATTAPSTPGCRIWPACMSTGPPIPSAPADRFRRAAGARQAGAFLPAFLALAARR